MEQTYEVFYDEIADFLEIFIGSPTKCYAEEIEPGIVIRKDETTDEIKSIGIFSFKKRAIVLKEILEKMNLRFPLKVSV
jgi:hypothetical protein